MWCVLHKWKISNALDGYGQLEQRQKRHLVCCHSCREFFNSSLFLAEGLRSQAEDAIPEIPARLHDRIAESISGDRRPILRSKPFVRRQIVAAGMAAVVMLGVVLGTVIYGGMSRRANTVNTVTTLRSIFGSEGLTAISLPESLGGALERPLSGEIRNLANQTESAVEFLVACVKVDVGGNMGAFIEKN
jgi:predicted anti-sigma-YlaC factor YlaD